jgi:hypothetical protein
VGVLLLGQFDYEDTGGSPDEGGYPAKIGTVNYGVSLLSEPTQSAVLEWQAANTGFLIGGEDPTAYSGSFQWTPYYAVNFYWWHTRYTEAKTFAAANGFVFEDMFVHMVQDYTARHPWAQMECFGCFERQWVTGATNGVISDSGGVLTDYSNRACGFTSGTFSFSDYLYVGHELPFDEMNFVLSVAGSSVTGTWQYWDGDSWETLAVTDGTSAFTGDGQITFTPPSDWARTIVNSSWSKYFVRYSITGGTPPTIDTLKGDDWLSSTGTHNCRGWDDDDENIVNSGELMYNPTPPVGATARFKHQARATGFWQTGLLYTNRVYQEEGVYAVARFLANQIVALDEDATGVMVDSLGGTLAGGIIDPADNAEAYSDFPDFFEGTWEESWQTFLTAFGGYIRTDRPGFLFGGNSPFKTYLPYLDWIVYEYAGSPSSNGALERMAYSEDGAGVRYDDFSEEHNPTGKSGVFMLQDVLDHIATDGGGFWDRSNRGPLAALATHYIASNDHTYLHYFTWGAWAYYDTDEIYTWNASTTTLTQAITADSSEDVKDIHVADASAFPDSGVRTLKIGSNVILPSHSTTVPGFSKSSNTLLTTTKPIWYDVDNGAEVRFLSQTYDRMSNYEGSGYPEHTTVWKWANYFPAMYIDVGQPDAGGWNSGQRGEWQTGVWRRDFENAIVLYRKISSRTKENLEDATVYSLGANYKTLYADGTQGDNISEVSLRQAEGAVLFYAGDGPTVESAEVSSNGTQIVITCSESIEPASSITGFSISGASDAEVNTGTASGSTITLSLTGTIVEGETITLSYSSGNVTDTNTPALFLIAFADAAVTNSSSVASVPATITIASSATAINTSTDDDELVVDVPSGTEVGDLLVAVASVNTFRSLTSPTGWTQQFSQTSGSRGKLYLFSKIAAAGDTAGSFTFSGATYLRGHIVVMRITGAIGTFEYESSQSSTFSSVAQCPDLSVASDGSYVLSIETATHSGDSALAGITELYDNDNDIVFQMGIYGEASVSSGLYGGQAIVLSSGSSYTAMATVSITPKLVAA